jgi:hypothetical protein
MKTRLEILLVIVLSVTGCSSPKYLPASDSIDINHYGSHISINYITGDKINGELIAINKEEMVVLMGTDNKNNKRCVSFPLTEIKSFRLAYASPKNYGWTIPTFTLFTIAHGYFFLLTAPINLITTIAVTTSGENAFVYSNKNMTYDKMKMFARFPQGLPPGIDLANIQ